MKVIAVLLLALSLNSVALAQSEVSEPPYILPEELDSGGSSDFYDSGDPFTQNLEDIAPGEDALSQAIDPGSPAVDKPSAEEELQSNDLKSPMESEMIGEVPNSESLNLPSADSAGDTVRLNSGPKLPPVEYIQHPWAEKGLYLIDEQGRYHYKTYEGEKTSQSSWIHFGSADPTPSIYASDGVTSFDELYDGPPYPYFAYEYEWVPFTSFGKLGFLLGFGLFYQSGRGQFVTAPVDPDCAGGCEPPEKFTFIGLPLTASTIYRFEYSSKQWFTPYIGGGGAYYVLAELRSDEKVPHGVGTPALFGFGGAMVSVSRLDPEARYTLISEYDIQNLWISMEYRVVQGLSEDLDVSANILSLGITFDY